MIKDAFLESMFSFFSEKAKKVIADIEKIASEFGSVIEYEMMPSNNVATYGDNYCNENVFTVRVKIKNENNVERTLGEIECTVIHELLHIRQTLYNFPIIYNCNDKLKYYEKVLGTELVGIRNFGSFLGHLELFPILDQLGYSFAMQIENDLEKLKSLSVQISNRIKEIKGLSNQSLETIYVANVLIMILNLYVFSDKATKKSIHDIYPCIAAQLRNTAEKLLIGPLKDDLTVRLGFRKYLLSLDIAKNCLALLDIIGINGLGLIAIRMQIET